MSDKLKVTFYMKSGNSFTVALKSCNWEFTSEALTKVSWVNSGQKRIGYISLDQVEAIVSEEFDQ